ncbi:amidohydrolase family protein [Pontixanthobacter gangjinensis]|uniref:Amidohydrolase family protein n=1 Tax=Pontixanthobacter gangjinensis TaxID=1028742 RepID=A0A6I4SM37_9SPHN|nr:amidohydrolase family protein [Pontixanthobacter gangjinensis]MXO56216.1 amidohydrolase family protein [Pontixanthobacter gangjinensis]
MIGFAKLLSGVATAALAITATAAFAETTYIHAGAVLTDAGSEPSGPATIIVTDGKIVSIEDGFLPTPDGAVMVHLPEKTVLPGLIDLHVHLTGDPGGDFWKEATTSDEWGVVIGAKNARLTALAGFTTVREAGSAQQTAYALRRGTAEGLVAGPRIIAAGPALAIVGGHGDVSGFKPEVNAVLTSGYTCTGATECAEKVRRAAQNGADVIKITATGGVLSQQGAGLEAHFSDAEMTSIADTARSLGLKVMAHAHGARGIEAASRAGINTIEHGTFIDKQAAQAMSANGTILVPTLMAFQGVSEGLGKGIYTPVVEDKIRSTVDVALSLVTRAREEGVEVAFGTDAGVFPHGRNAEEFALMVSQGMTNREALASATTIAARVLNMENEIGRIAAGYSADIIAVNGNPLTDVTVLENVDWVMVRGAVVE